MPVLDVSPLVRYRLYLTAIDDAESALEIMMTLPPELEPARELAEALHRVIEAVKVLDLPQGASTDLLDAIAAGGQS